MAANKFVLKGPGVGLHDRRKRCYSRTGVHSRGFPEKVQANDVLSEDTGLGRMVSVALILTIDTGGERFGFFLPFIDVPRGQTAHFHTVWLAM
jgi:hypothetical protein